MSHNPAAAPAEAPPSPPPAAPADPFFPPKAAAAAFVIAIIWVFVTPFCTRDAPVSESTVQTLTQQLSQLPPRTFILVHPPWRTDVQQRLLERLGPVELGPALPLDAMEKRRPVVAILVPNAPDPGALSRWIPDDVRKIDDVEVRFFFGASRAVDSQPVAPMPPQTSPPPDAPSTSGAWRIETALASAQVRVTSARGTIECNVWDPPNSRWVCPNMNEWNFVGPRNLAIEDKGRRCIWAHPVTDATLSIRFPNVPAGKIAFGHALSDGAGGVEGASDVKTVFTAGNIRSEIVHPNAPGWREDMFDLAAATDVQLDITTPHDGARHFCIWLERAP